MSEQKKKEVNMEIQLDEEIAQGVFANLAVMNHNEGEFVIDFIFVQPQVTRAKVRSRVVTTPLHAKRLLLALEENVRKYEKKFGTIKAAPVPSAPVSLEDKVH
ncbi:MAG: DUF3467 domain-containing protein [Desulfuromonas sp.]|uniref:DUF3467 domain-containing protein n=1 Tax=Desulfuromonas sp. TaxID=892 RepID=UPI000CA9C3C3|nr:DUF3467 domain-containing protein [Desulfuromonas sp.]PLX84179.1 MAG: DUF3467 domain-containing protein [Desulfuromonas sp.]